MSVDVRTDDPDLRFAIGTPLATDPASAGPLVVGATRWHSGRLLVAFEGVADRTAAEELRGVSLLIDPSADAASLADPEEFWDHQLEGLAVVTVDGAALGTVEQVLHLPGGDVLAVHRSEGRELLVPFVGAIVPTVDLPGGRLVVDPPPGLLDLDGG